jgi:hypothetical protein
MAHTRNQELESRFNTLQHGLLETQQEVQQLTATIASRDASMNASVQIAVQSAMAEVKNELESVVVALCTKLKIPLDDDAPKKTEGILLGPNLLLSFMNALTLTPTIWAV